MNPQHLWEQQLLTHNTCGHEPITLVGTTLAPQMKLKNKIKNQLNKNKIQLIKQQINQHIEKVRLRNVAEQVKTRGVYKQAGWVKGFLGARQKRG